MNIQDKLRNADRLAIENHHFKWQKHKTTINYAFHYIQMF